MPVPGAANKRATWTSVRARAGAVPKAVVAWRHKRLRGESVLVQNRELTHGEPPIRRGGRALFGDVAKRQANEFAGGLGAGKRPRVLITWHTLALRFSIALVVQMTLEGQQIDRAKRLLASDEHPDASPRDTLESRREALTQIARQRRLDLTMFDIR
jgi:hypothetical protein